jgi:crotonobetainyl-CoA:carnitine CoA-transferase CaiB-like acyl-CoA transferase
MHSVIPRLSETQGTIRSAGGELGADTEAVLSTELGIDGSELTRLRERGIV